MEPALSPNDGNGLVTSRPQSVAEAVAITEELAREFSVSAADRDRAGGTPHHERKLLRRSGLLTLLVPQAYGGIGANWSTIQRVVQRFAQVDASIAHVFAFQHLMLATVRLFGSASQWGAHFTNTVRDGWFWGNAVNPLDARVTAVRGRAGELILTGKKSFCSGATDSDMLVVSAIPPEDTRLIIAAIPTGRKGVVVHQDWNNIGQRQTDSGTVEFNGVVIESAEILRSPGPLGSVYASLRPCISQLLLTSIYLGVAEGAFEAARGFVSTEARPWFASGVDRPDRDPYTLEHMGSMWVGLESARALTQRATLGLQNAWENGDNLTARERGECALAIAAAKVSATRVGLDVTSRIFEVMGARATSGKYGFDRYWRNLRTLTLHDPVDYRVRELGTWSLTGDIPVPSFYS
jgi:alkylation response protein AidB-like acyl-CoA dehydrogenase